MSGDWPTGDGEMAARIRAFDWSTTPLGPIAAWPQSLKVTLANVLASGFPGGVLWGEHLVQIYNDGYRALMGLKHPAGLGQPTQECWPEIWRVNAPIYEQVCAGETVTFEDKLFPITRSGGLKEAWFTLSYSPVKGDDGSVAGVLVTVFDTTSRVQADRTAEESADRFRVLIESWAQAVWETDADGLVVRDSPSWRAYTGQTFEQLIGYGWVDAVHPDDRERAGRAWREAVAAARELSEEFRVRRADGAWRWTNVRAAPIRGAGGELRKWVGMNVDITERRDAEAALLESDQRFRQFADAASDLLWIRDARTLRWEFLSSSFQQLYGLSLDEALSGDALKAWNDLVVPADRDATMAALRKVADGEQVTFEHRVQRPDTGELRWARNTAFPVRDAAGWVRRIGGVTQDVTEEKEATRHQAMLLAELQHRTRNLLGVVRSIARRTAETSEDVEGFLTHFDGRLSAIARTQTALSRNHEISAGLDALILEEFLAAAGADQVTLEGPELQLSGKIAESITLAMHELVTNALKYGALTTPQGHVYVSWALRERDGRTLLALNWRETGVGVIDVRPRRMGFGRRLLEKALPYELGAATTLRFAPGGVRASIEVPLPSGGEEARDGA